MSGNHNALHDAMVAALRRKLESIGCMTIHLTSYTAREIGRQFIRIPLKIEKGWPDVISFRPDGKVDFYEVKTGESVLNADQRRVFSELTRRGFIIYIVRETTREVYKCKGKND